MYMELKAELSKTTESTALYNNTKQTTHQQQLCYNSRLIFVCNMCAIYGVCKFWNFNA